VVEAAALSVRELALAAPLAAVPLLPLLLNSLQRGSSSGERPGAAQAQLSLLRVRFPSPVLLPRMRLGTP
jgi:hypothetical protein